MSDETLDKPVTKKITIWSEPRTMADYDFVCVEPWVGEPNTINTHPIMVPPGGVWNMSMKFEVEFI